MSDADALPDPGLPWPAIRMWVRRVLALGWLALGAVLVLLVGLPRQCATTGSRTDFVRTCEPMSATAPEVLVFLLVLAMLLAPEFSEFEVPGLVAFKRSVAAATGEVEDLREQVAAVSQDVKLSSASAAEARVAQQFVFPLLRETGEALGVATGAPPGTVKPRVALSAPAQAQAAFVAGFTGLDSLLPGPTRLVGFTTDGEGWEAPHADEGTEELVGELERLLHEATAADPAGGPGESWDLLYERSPSDPSLLLVVAPARQSGQVVAALGVIADTSADTGTSPGDSAGGGPGGEMGVDGPVDAASVEELAVATQTAADVYATLLVMLLGESAPVSRV
ncbi:hypothetical protein KLP28_08570 [Nocardioidaceae bacterium]|nr:hypothetical protein KLP28_08570 [Nocardioidaceae bacterium]